MTFTSDTPFEKKPKSPEGSWGKSSDTPTQDSSWKSKDNPADASKWKQKEPAQATEKSWASSSKKPQSTSLEDQIGTNKLDTPDYDSVENRRQRARANRDEDHINRLQSNIDKNQKWADHYRDKLEEARKKFGDDHWHTKGIKRDLARHEKELDRFSREKEDAMNADNPEYKKEEKLKAKTTRLQKQIDRSNREIATLQARLDSYAREGWEPSFGPARLTRGSLGREQKKLARLQEQLESLQNQDSFGEEEMAPESMSFSEAKEKWKTLGYEFSEAQVPEGWKTYYS